MRGGLGGKPNERLEPARLSRPLAGVIGQRMES